MHNKELYGKIINVSCSFEELESFVSDISKKEFDIDNSFEKYYDLERILFAISRYEKKEINDKYLAYWMCAYNWIIMAGFRAGNENVGITFQEWVLWEISDWLDSLSFFDDSDDWFNLDDYKNSFRIIDEIYKNLNDWECIFAHTDEWGDNDDDVVLLTINNKAKKFVKIYASLDYHNEKVDFPRIEEDELGKKIKQLKKVGYRELRYGLFDEKEE